MTITSEIDWGARSLARDRANRSRAFAGIISLFAGIVFLLAFAWLILAGQFFLIQLPLILGSLALLIFFGVGYIVNPPVWVGAVILSLLYFGQDFTIRQSLVSDGGTDLQSMVKGLIAALLMVYGLFNGMSRVFKHPVLWLFAGYAAFAALSASYSSAMALGIGSGLALLGIAFATARASTMSLQDLQTYWRGLYVAAVVMGVASLILLAVFKPMALDLADPGAFRLKGFTGSANSLGPIMTVGFIISLTMYRVAERRWVKNMHAMFGLMMLAALVLTNSRSSLLGLGMGLAAAAVVMRGHTVLTVLLGGVAATVAAMVVLLPSLTKAFVRAVTELFSRSGGAQEIVSFTGRSDIWLACLELIRDKPWIGYGLGSVRVELPKVFEDQWGNTAATAHNFVLESLITVGVVGTIPLLLVFVVTTVGLVRHMNMRKSPYQDVVQREWSACALRVVFMLWIHALVERAFAGTAAPSTVVLGVCVATYAYTSMQIRAEKQSRLLRIREMK